MSLFDDASLVLTPNGYKASKLYSIKPTSGLGDMTVVRATTIATRVNSANLIESVATNVPRLDYPPLGGCPSILVEPLRTNLVFYSEQFNNVSWLKYLATVTSNSQQAPDGTTTADLAYPSTTGALAGQLYKSVAGITAGNVVTVSAFVKASGKNFAYIGPLYNFSPAAWFNLTTGAITNPIVNVTTSMTEFPNGWWRISVTSTATATSFMTIGSTDAAGSVTNTASGTNGILVWGAQVEVGTKVSSYIPTTTASVTRNADVISQTGISSLIGQTEGTIYAEINNTLMTSYSTGYVMRIFADANNEVWIRKESGTNTYTAKWRANSVDVYTQSTISVLNGNNKIAIAYKTGSSAVYLNGSQIGTSASTGAFSVAPSQIGIGSSSTADFFNDRIELATLFPTRLTNAQLATLTTL